MPMAVNLGAPSEPDVETIQLEKFKGVDFTSSDVNVDIRRSPDAPNMIPDEDGYPCKRTGWHTVLKLEGEVHAAYTLKMPEETHELIHCGTNLYEISTENDGTKSAEIIYYDMNDAPSCAVTLNGKLWILDGQTYLYYDGRTCAPVSFIATVPKITIAKAPNGKGGATSYKPVNLLTGRKTESYLGTETDVDYYVSFNPLLKTTVTAEKLNASGAWVSLKENTDFTVDRTLGKITFKAAPGKSPVEGEDNVHITYETKSNADKVNACCFSILYGVLGAMDRVFMSGSANEPNIDYYSEWNDPAYIGDTNYGQLGQSNSAITGYSVINDLIVAHKANEENERNAFVRAGTLDSDGFAVFAIKNVLQGEGACARRSFCNANTEPLFLTKLGIYALAASDVSGERYAQNRSYYINKVLRDASNLENACCTVWGRFYVLSLGSRLYLLDTSQKTYESKGPSSAYQYECYYFDNIDATAIWSHDGVLCFGTADGSVREFYKSGSATHYSDDGAPIKAYWTTPMMHFDYWGYLKSIVGCWVVAKPYSRSGGDIYYSTDKKPRTIVKSYSLDIFDFSDIDFRRWTFNTLDRPNVINARKKARKVKVFQVRVENANAAEPFGVLGIMINYKLAGKVKR